jgi:hypothetical protein
MSIVLAILLAASATPSPEVPEEIVFDVCRAGYPDVARDGRFVSRNSARRQKAAADMWALSDREREYVQEKCSSMADRILRRIVLITFDVETGKPQRTFPESNPR